MGGAGLYGSVASGNTFGGGDALGGGGLKMRPKIVGNKDKFALKSDAVAKDINEAIKKKN